jgi:hypothetical protein
MVRANIIPLIIKFSENEAICFAAKDTSGSIFFFVPGTKIFCGIYLNFKFSATRGPILKSPLVSASAAQIFKIHS